MFTISMQLGKRDQLIHVDLRTSFSRQILIESRAANVKELIEFHGKTSAVSSQVINFVTEATTYVQYNVFLKLFEVSVWVSRYVMCHKLNL